MNNNFNMFKQNEIKQENSATETTAFSKKFINKYEYLKNKKHFKKSKKSKLISLLIIVLEIAFILVAFILSLINAVKVVMKRTDPDTNEKIDFKSNLATNYTTKKEVGQLKEKNLNKKK